jgi:putative transferase (TIGR04331 family)
MGPASEQRVILTNKIFSQIYLILNEIHQVNYSERFWRIILAPYVSAIISDMNKIDNRLVGLKIPNELYRNTLFPEKHYVRFMYLRQFVKYFQSLPHKRNSNSQLKKNQIITTGFHGQERVPSVGGSYIKALYSFMPYIKTNSKMRIGVNRIVNNLSKEFSIDFYLNIVDLMPKVYIEDFKRIHDSIQLYDPNSKSFHISFLESTYMRILIAKYVENGSKLYYYQHGSFYGDYEFLSLHRFETSIADKFMTWGWKLLPNDCPSYAYRLNTFVSKYKEAFKSNFKYDLIFVIPGIENKNRDAVKSELHNLLESVDREKYSRMCIRPRPIAKINRKGEFGFINDNTVYLDSGYSTMVNLIAESKFVVQLEYPSTNFLECLSVDHPVVALLKNDTPSEIVKPHYDYLLSVGIFHKDVDTLITHLNSIDLPKWWADTILSPGYISFKREFLNLKKN